MLQRKVIRQSLWTISRIFLMTELPQRNKFLEEDIPLSLPLNPVNPAGKPPATVRV